MHTKKRIAIQGIAGSYHHEAAVKYFEDESSITLLECDSFRQLGNALKNDEADYAVMAIENTIAGSILSNYSLISRQNHKIIGEAYLRIHHHLMCHPTSDMRDISEIHSHPMALLQCEDYFETVPEIKLVETVDTAQSAKDIHQNNLKNVAAIAPKKSADIYDLRIINNNIQANKDNFTRFFILDNKGSQEKFFNKVSIRFSLANYAGTLVSVLSEISNLGVNMTKIQSVPIITDLGEYSFYLDLVFDNQSIYEELIIKLQQKITDLQILGKYVNERPKW